MINTLLLLLILILLIICLKKSTTELFMKHNCPPYTSVLRPDNSFNTFSKGWCTTADLSELTEDDIIEDSNKESNMQCIDGSVPLSASNSYQSDTKGRCSR